MCLDSANLALSASFWAWGQPQHPQEVEHYSEGGSSEYPRQLIWERQLQRPKWSLIRTSHSLDDPDLALLHHHLLLLRSDPPSSAFSSSPPAQYPDSHPERSPLPCASCLLSVPRRMRCSRRSVAERLLQRPPIWGPSRSVSGQITR